MLKRISYSSPDISEKNIESYKDIHEITHVMNTVNRHRRHVSMVSIEELIFPMDDI